MNTHGAKFEWEREIFLERGQLELELESVTVISQYAHPADMRARQIHWRVGSRRFLKQPVVIAAERVHQPAH